MQIAISYSEIPGKLSNNVVLEFASISKIPLPILRNIKIKMQKLCHGGRQQHHNSLESLFPLNIEIESDFIYSCCIGKQKRAQKRIRMKLYISIFLLFNAVNEMWRTPMREVFHLRFLWTQNASSDRSEVGKNCARIWWLWEFVHTINLNPMCNETSDYKIIQMKVSCSHLFEQNIIN